VPPKKVSPLVLLTWSDVLAASADLPLDQRELVHQLASGEMPRDEESSSLTSRGRWLISKVEIRGHVGIGERPLILNLVPSTGIAFISARNGVGKTSSADAIRHVLSGGSSRLYDLTAENVHYGLREIHVTVTDGLREAVIGCVGDGPVTWDGAGVPSEWNSAYQRFRPVLLYPEISPMIERPAELHDFLHGGLETEVLSELLRRVDGVRAQGREAKRRVDGTFSSVKSLAGNALSSEAHAKVVSFGDLPSTEDFPAIRAVIETAPDQADDGLIPIWKVDTAVAETVIRGINELQQAKSMVVPGALAVRQALESILGTFSDERQAQDSTVCPVCGANSIGWQDHARASLEELSKELHRVHEAQRNFRIALNNLEPSLPPPLADTLRTSLVRHGLSQTVDLWDKAVAEKRTLSELSTETAIINLIKSSAKVASSYSGFKADRDVENSAKGAGMAKAGQVIETWIKSVEENRSSIASGKLADALGRWVDKSIKETRAALFEPIANEVKEIWGQLNADSDLVLTDVRLGGGSRAAKKVEFGLNVEGVAVPPGAKTPSIMSTGQRNALSLATYFPRAAQQDSPFGFLVLDDPVQSFDSWRVRYLADRLRKIAENNQVIVLSHDERLWSELQRYGSIRQSIRLDRPQGNRSKVRVTEKSAGILLLDDLAGTINAEGRSPVGVPTAVSAMTLAMCRLALDAEVGIQIEIVGRRVGLSDSEIEAAREKAHDTRKKIALLNEYAVQAGYPTIATEPFERTIAALNAGAHGRAPSANAAQRRRWIEDVRILIKAALGVSA
jgi:hypothetical protein